jgi:predicted TIM-barrel fold metal-dependent hydrolase
VQGLEPASEEEMQCGDLILISVDDHIVEPAEMFERHVPAAFKDEAPKYVVQDNGDGFWVFEDRIVANLGVNAVVGRPRHEYGMEPTALSQLREAAYNVHKRIEDMNVNGLLAALNFGTFVGFDGGFFAQSKDKALAYAMVQAYNDWHIDEWCGAYPGRFIPMAILPIWDIGLVVKEIKRVTRKGCHAVAFSDNPALKGFPSIHNDYWEPMWKLCAEEHVVLNCHIGTGAAAAHASMESPIDAWITSMPISISNSAADWLQLRALQRYPDLKVALSEGGIGWIPYFLERADFTYEHHHEWTGTSFGGRKPSDLFREHFITCFIDDRFGVKNRADIGVDIICYECDYPHSDSLWPDSPEHLMLNLQGCTDEEINKISHLNAMRTYRFDPFKHIPREQCTVAALRAQAKHVDTVPRSSGGKRPVQGEARIVTSGDVVKMFARAGRSATS